MIRQENASWSCYDTKSIAVNILNVSKKLHTIKIFLCNLSFAATLDFDVDDGKRYNLLTSKSHKLPLIQETNKKENTSKVKKKQMTKQQKIGRKVSLKVL